MKLQNCHGNLLYVSLSKLHKLHKLRSLRRSFLHFHFISAVHIWFISYIINTHFFQGNIWTHNWPAPSVSGFIAQLVKHRTAIARSRVQTPLKSWIFYSGFFTQLHKLRLLRRSSLHFRFICAVHVWFISYIINRMNSRRPFLKRSPYYRGVTVFEKTWLCLKEGVK